MIPDAAADHKGLRVVRGGEVVQRAAEPARRFEHHGFGGGIAAARGIADFGRRPAQPLAEVAARDQSLDVAAVAAAAQGVRIYILQHVADKTTKTKQTQQKKTNNTQTEAHAGAPG